MNPMLNYCEQHENKPTFNGHLRSNQETHKNHQKLTQTSRFQQLATNSGGGERTQWPMTATMEDDTKIIG